MNEPKFKPGDRVRFVDGSEHDEPWTVTNSSSEPPIFKYSVMSAAGKLMTFIHEEWMVLVPKELDKKTEEEEEEDDELRADARSRIAEEFWEDNLEGSKKDDETLADFLDLIEIFEGTFEQKMSGNAQPMIVRERLERFEQLHGVGFTKFLLAWLETEQLIDCGISVRYSWLTPVGIIVRTLASNADLKQ